MKFRIGPSLPAGSPAEPPAASGWCRIEAQSEESRAPAQACLPAPRAPSSSAARALSAGRARFRTEPEARALGPQPLRWTSSPRGRRAERNEPVPQTTAQAGLSLRTGDPPGHSARSRSSLLRSRTFPGATEQKPAAPPCPVQTPRGVRGWERTASQSAPRPASLSTAAWRPPRGTRSPSDPERRPQERGSRALARAAHGLRGHRRGDLGAAQWASAEERTRELRAVALGNAVRQQEGAGG